MTVLIPAYNPDEKLLDLLRELPSDMPVLIVNDGSDSSCDFIFEKARALGAVVLTHEENKGKGAALRTGIAYLSAHGETEGVITANADGQHSYEDIMRIVEVMRAEPGTFVMGGRDFSKMPFRSRFGNTATRFLFRFSTGLNISDTQTGLRGLPAQIFDKLLSVPGDRYEYEINVLLALKEWKTPYKEITISTIYYENNKSSHFRPLLDGFQVFIRVVLYALSSLTCTILDYAVYLILTLFGILPGVCYVAARVISAITNYMINCKVVFKGKLSLKSALQYALLVIIVMAFGTTCITYLTAHSINPVIAKMIVDCITFVVNYFVQRKVIFKK